MLYKSVFIIFFMLVSAGFAFLGNTQVSAEPFVVSESYVDGKNVKVTHGAFGEKKKTYFWNGTEYVEGYEINLWIVEGAIGATDLIEPRETDGSARKAADSSEFISENGWYSGGYPFSTWP